MPPPCARSSKWGEKNGFFLHALIVLALHAVLFGDFSRIVVQDRCRRIFYISALLRRKALPAQLDGLGAVYYKHMCEVRCMPEVLTCTDNYGVGLDAVGSKLST